MILVSDRFMAGSGLVVSRMLGLRNPEQFNAAAVAFHGSPVAITPRTPTIRAIASATDDGPATVTTFAPTRCANAAC